MLAFANCGALILSGAVLGTCIDHGFMGAGIEWLPFCTSVLVAIIATENVRKVFVRSGAVPVQGHKSVGRARQFLETANEQNLDRLAAEVRDGAAGDSPQGRRP